MELETFKKYWNILKSNYQDKTHTTQDLSVYYSILKNYSDKDFKKAIKEVLKNNNYFPRINEIIEYLPQHDINNKVSYAPDGVMLWDNKRCEIQKPTPEEIKEMEMLLEI